MTAGTDEDEAATLLVSLFVVVSLAVITLDDDTDDTSLVSSCTPLGGLTIVGVVDDDDEEEDDDVSVETEVSVGATDDDDDVDAAVAVAGVLLSVAYDCNPSNLITPCPNTSSLPVPRPARLPTNRHKKYIFSNANHDDVPTTGFNTGVSSDAHRATDDCESMPFSSVVIVAGGVRLPRDVSASAEPKNVR